LGGIDVISTRACPTTRRCEQSYRSLLPSLHLQLWGKQNPECAFVACCFLASEVDCLSEDGYCSIRDHRPARMMASPTRSLQQSDEEEDNDRAEGFSGLLAFLKDLVLSPIQAILAFISSPTFLRVSISTLLFFAVSTALLAISTTAYLLFYYSYIPPINLSIPLYLQYGVPDTAPYALADIPPGALVSQEGYDVVVQLEMPRTPANIEAGPFMIDVRLLGPFDPLSQPPETLTQLLGNITTMGGGGYSVLRHSRRPAMLRYKSPLPGLARQVLNLPLHVLGMKDLDVDEVRVRMLEQAMFDRGSLNVPRRLRVEVAAGDAPTGAGRVAAISQVQVYKANINFTVRFRGLRWLIYHHRIFSFVVFTTTFYLMSVISMGVVWAWLGPMGRRAPEHVEGRGTGKYVKSGEEIKRIKTEDDEDTADSGGFKLEDLGESPQRFPSSRGGMALQYEGRQKEEEPTALPEKETGEADDEDEEYFGSTGRATGRYAGDSGIGTMSESHRENLGPVRRRSGQSKPPSQDT
jgi:seipin